MFTTAASLTAGTIKGLIGLGVLLVAGLGIILTGVRYRLGRERAWPWFLGGALSIALSLVIWWVAMAFTTSGDYHAWNVKEGDVQRVNKRLVSAGEKGMEERFVVVIDGQPYGVDDTRAALLRPGDFVSLRCKKEFQWGVPREAHNWACRWNSSGAIGVGQRMKVRVSYVVDLDDRNRRRDLR